MTERKLPAGWTWTALREAAVVSPRDPALDAAAPFVTMSAVEVGVRHPVSYEQRGSRAGIRARGNDVLFARITPCLENGKVALLPETTEPTGGSTEFIVIRPTPAVDPVFLYYWCLHPDVRNNAQHQMAGVTGRMRLAGSDLAKFELPLPPLPEQHRIVEVLEDYFSRLDAADSGVRSAVARTSNLTSSSHRAALSGIGSGDSVRIGDIAKVGSGATPLRGNDQYYNGGTIPWATSGDLHAGDIFDVPGRITETALQETAVKLWPAGTLLVAMYGEGRTRGTVAELHIASTTNQACAAIVLHPEFAGLKRWVRFILRTRYDEMRSQASGGVQPNLSLGRIKEIPIPMPDVELRNAILAEDEANSEAVDRLRLAGKQSLARSTALRRSLLRAAFSGELVDQDPTDEPATVTLARIRAQQPGIKPRPRRKAVVAK